MCDGGTVGCTAKGLRYEGPEGIYSKAWLSGLGCWYLGFLGSGVTQHTECVHIFGLTHIHPEGHANCSFWYLR